MLSRAGGNMILKRSFRHAIFSLGCVALVTLSACSLPFLQEKKAGTVLVSVTVPGVVSETGARFIHPDTKKIIVTVTGADMAPMTGTSLVSINDKTATVELTDITAGVNRKITASLRDSADTVLAEGSVVTDIAEASITKAAITAKPVGATAATLGAPVIIPANSAGKTFMYSFTIAAAGDYLATPVLDGTNHLTPSIYDTDGIAVGTAPVSGDTCSFKASAAGTYYVILTLSSTWTGSATLAVTPASIPAKAITTFIFASPPASGTITEGTHSIAITVPVGTDVTSLVPAIVHNGASISPVSGVAQNFTNPVTYTVTASDGTTQAYTVTVTVSASSSKAITSFGFATPAVSGTVTEAIHSIAVTVPFGTSVTALVPSIAHTGSTISPANGVAQNFTNPVTYTVTAADGTTQAYTVTVNVAASSSKAITSFVFATPATTGTVNESSHTIAVTVPFGTNLTALVPSIIHTGATISPVNAAAQNFTNPVTYTVTAADGSTQAYVVTVALAASSSKAINSFSFATPAVSGTVTEAIHSIAVTVPFGTNVTALVPSIAHTGSSISPANGTAQNFTNPVTYTVTAADGSTQAYTVTVNVAANPTKAITSFVFATPAATGTVTEASHSIAVTVPFGTNLTALVPSIIHTGATINPVNAAAQNFTNPVTYTVTAADGSTQAYTVTVSLAFSTAKAITSFGFATPVVSGTVTESIHSIAVTVPFGTNVTALVPSIVHTGSTISPAIGTAQNFTNPVTYTVTAADGSTQAYTVTATVAPNPAKAITSFTFPSLAVSGTVTEATHAIVVTVPLSTNLTVLAPSIVHTGASISPGNGLALNFTNPVVYTVTAEDGTTQQYTISVKTEMTANNVIKGIHLIHENQPNLMSYIYIDTLNMLYSQESSDKGTTWSTSMNIDNSGTTVDFVADMDAAGRIVVLWINSPTKDPFGLGGKAWYESKILTASWGTANYLGTSNQVVCPSVFRSPTTSDLMFTVGTNDLSSSSSTGLVGALGVHWNGSSFITTNLIPTLTSTPDTTTAQQAYWDHTPNVLYFLYTHRHGSYRDIFNIQGNSWIYAGSSETPLVSSPVSDASQPYIIDFITSKVMIYTLTDNNLYYKSGTDFTVLQSAGVHTVASNVALPDYSLSHTRTVFIVKESNTPCLAIVWQGTDGNIYRSKLNNSLVLDPTPTLCATSLTLDGVSCSEGYLYISCHNAGIGRVIKVIP